MWGNFIKDNNFTICMQGTIFIRIIESEFRRMFSFLNGEWHKNTGSFDAYISHEPERTISTFKEWFRYAIRTTEVEVGRTVVDPRDLIVYATSRSSDTPPHAPIYPDIVKIISLFTDEGLEEIFGLDRTFVLSKAIGRSV